YLCLLDGAHRDLHSFPTRRSSDLKPRGIDVVPCAVYDSRTLCLTEDDPRLHGVWRSLVALLLWEQEVGGSNPSTPTKFPVAAGCWSSCRTLLSGTVKAGIRSRAAG